MKGAAQRQQVNKGFRFALSEEIYWKWRKDEALLAIIEGEFGSGKSSVCIQMLRELYPLGDDWRKYLVFKPEQFLDLVDSLICPDTSCECAFCIDHKRSTNCYPANCICCSHPPKKVPLIVWDDAGLWLYAMEWSDERVKSVVKFINVMRTVVGGLVLTTPTQDMIVGKIPAIPGVRIGSVVKAPGDRRDMRSFTVARTTKTKWGKRFVTDYIDDEFNVMLPGEIYSYYKPLRDTYAREANNLMREAWHHRLTSRKDRSISPP